MLEGLYSAAAGMSAQQEQLNAIGNDLANMSTSGYQAERVAFSDLLYNPTDIAHTETTVGAGASAQTIGRSEAQGAIKQTGDPLDLAIEGPGYFQVTTASGQVALTRDGNFATDASGTLVNAQGNRLAPPIKLPAGVAPSEVSISTDGTVLARGKKVGQIQLVTVTSPAGMLDAGNGELTPTGSSGPVHAAAGASTRGRWRNPTSTWQRRWPRWSPPSATSSSQQRHPDGEPDDVDRQPAAPMSIPRRASQGSFPSSTRRWSPRGCAAARPRPRRTTQPPSPSNGRWSNSSPSPSPHGRRRRRRR